MGKPRIRELAAKKKRLVLCATFLFAKFKSKSVTANAQIIVFTQAYT